MSEGDEETEEEDVEVEVFETRGGGRKRVMGPGGERLRGFEEVADGGGEMVDTQRDES